MDDATNLLPRFDDLVAYERGDLTFDETVALFQHLVDSGEIRRLQPYYVTTALALADGGHISAAALTEA
jgi:hypothetical protein